MGDGTGSGVLRALLFQRRPAPFSVVGGAFGSFESTDTAPLASPTGTESPSRSTDASTDAATDGLVSPIGSPLGSRARSLGSPLSAQEKPNLARILKQLLRDARWRDKLQAHLERRRAAESIQYWSAIEVAHQISDPAKRLVAAREVVSMFVLPTANAQVCLSPGIAKNICAELGLNLLNPDANASAAALLKLLVISLEEIYKDLSMDVKVLAFITDAIARGEIIVKPFSRGFEFHR